MVPSFVLCDLNSLVLCASALKKSAEVASSPLSLARWNIAFDVALGSGAGAVGLGEGVAGRAAGFGAAGFAAGVVDATGPVVDLAPDKPNPAACAVPPGIVAPLVPAGLSAGLSAGFSVGFASALLSSPDLDAM